MRMAEWIGKSFLCSKAVRYVFKVRSSDERMKDEPPVPLLHENLLLPLSIAAGVGKQFLDRFIDWNVVVLVSHRLLARGGGQNEAVLGKEERVFVSVVGEEDLLSRLGEWWVWRGVGWRGEFERKCGLLRVCLENHKFSESLCIVWTAMCSRAPSSRSCD